MTQGVDSDPQYGKSYHATIQSSVVDTRRIVTCQPTPSLYRPDESPYPKIYIVNKPPKLFLEIQRNSYPRHT